RRGLVISEIALAMVLLVGAGLMIKSYARLIAVDVGLDPNHIMSLEINLAGMDRYRTRHGTNHYSVTPEVSNLYSKLLRRIALLQGVEYVGATSNLPPRGGPSMPFRIVGNTSPPTGETMETFYHEVSPEYFETMHIPVVRGRAFTDRDDENTPGAVIIN